ncbi:hypothetical protein D3C73_1462900 [compost metagenome]
MCGHCKARELLQLESVPAVPGIDVEALNQLRAMLHCEPTGFVHVVHFSQSKVCGQH